MKRDAVKEKLPLTQKVSHGVGHVLNDLVANVWFSYLLIYLTKVVGLSNSHTGYVAMLGQVIDGICTPFIAILNDRTVCRYGRRKVWHLVGWVFVCIAFPLLFTQLLPRDTSAASKLAYYICITGLLQFGWGCMQISHLSLIPEISRRESELVELNAIRSAMRFVCGIFVFGVTWILLGRSSDETISHSTWKQFMHLSIIVIITGSVFNLFFHIWIREPPSEALLRWKENRTNRRTHKQRNNSGATDQLEPREASAYSQDAVAKECDERNCENITIDEISCYTTCKHKDARDEGRTRMQWLKRPGLYKTGLIYIVTRTYVNISQAYLPLYLVEAMKFEKEAVAYFPLVVLVSGVLASTGVKRLTKWLGSKTTFCLGAVIAVGASCWFKVQPMDKRNAVYVPAVLMGSGGSVMLITSLSLIAHLIGHDKKSGAFVYGVIGFFDKVVSGVVFAVIQEKSPHTDQTGECLSCDDFLRNVQSIIPAAPVALLTMFIIFDSIFFCKRRVQVNHVETQTNFDEKCIEDVKCHTVVMETSRSHFCVFENKALSLSEENLVACPTDSVEHEDRDMLTTTGVGIETESRTDLAYENGTGEGVSNETVSKSLTNLDEDDVKTPNTRNEDVETQTGDENRKAPRANSHEYHNKGIGMEDEAVESSPDFNDSESKDTSSSAWADSAPTDYDDKANNTTSTSEDAKF